MKLCGAPTVILISVIGLWLCASTSVRSEQPKVKIDLLSNGIGVPPADFDIWRTGQGEVGQWVVVRDSTAVTGASIEQFSTDKTKGRFQLAIYKPISAKNIEISTRFKIVSGTMHSAGVAFRLTSPGNYYLARVSALEKRVDLFRVVRGKIERIVGADVEVMQNRWHLLGVATEDDRFTISVDGQPTFTAWDRTFRGDGHVALWAEEDNVTRFQEIEITPIPNQPGE
jgi:hypothetical protein